MAAWGSEGLYRAAGGTRLRDAGDASLTVALAQTPGQRALRARTLTAATRLNHDLTACEREVLADELAAIAMELRA